MLVTMEDTTLGSEKEDNAMLSSAKVKFELTEFEV